MTRLVFNPATGKLEVVAGSDSCKSSTGGISVIYKEANIFTDTTETEVLTYTSSNDDTKIIRFLGEADTFGVWRVYKGTIATGNLEVVFRTSETVNNLDFLLVQGIELDDTEVLRITFQAHRYRTKYLGTSGNTFIRIEGSY